MKATQLHKNDELISKLPVVNFTNMVSKGSDHYEAIRYCCYESHTKFE